jgi:TM2 domain-containing membrane protein YozV
MKLIIQNNLDGSQRTVELNRAHFSVGRSATSDIILQEDRASAQHLDIAVAADHITVKDNYSVSGTRLNGLPLLPNESYRVGLGDRLEIGSTLITLQTDMPYQQYYQASPPPPTQTFTPPPPALPQYYQGYQQPNRGVQWTLPWMHIPVSPMPVLNPNEAMLMESQFNAQRKDLGIAYLLWFFLGWLGVHKFYLNRIGEGIIYIILFVSIIGWLALPILWLIDAFLMPEQTRQENDRLRWEIANRILWMRNYPQPPYV